MAADADDTAMPADHVGPLNGKRILVTRAQAQAGALVALLRAAGATPIELPVIYIEPADDYAALDQALLAIQRYDWMVFTSVNTIAYVEERLRQLGLTWHTVAGLGVAAIGPKTAGELRTRGVRVSFMPREYVSTAVAAELPVQEGQRVLLARADIADKRLVEGLRARGAVVDEFAAYRTSPSPRAATDARALLADVQIDVVTFTSSSTVRNLCAALGDDAPELLAGKVIACIGPVTAATARECGLHPTIIARNYTIDGLAEALIQTR